MFLFFSLRQSTFGEGLPEALQARVAFSPSETETSPSEVPEVRMSGATGRDKCGEESDKGEKNEEIRIYESSRNKIKNSEYEVWLSPPFCSGHKFSPNTSTHTS